MRGAAGDRAEEALDRAGAIVRVEALHPGLVRLDPCFRGQPVKPDIFWRSVSQEIVAHVDPHAADAADLLHPRQRELPLTEPLKDVLTIGGVAERDPDPLAQREGAHFVIAVRPPPRIRLEDLLFAAGHDLPVASLELGADRSGRDVPNHPADDVLALELEHLFGGAIEGDEAPLRIESEEPFRQTLQNFLDGQSRDVAGRSARLFPLSATGLKEERICSRSWIDA